VTATIAVLKKEMNNNNGFYTSIGMTLLIFLYRRNRGL